MKIKNLLLLGLMTIGSMNAFAVDHKVEGITYEITTVGTVTTAKVKSISAGMKDASAATITIPKSIKDGDGNTVNVVGFNAGWATADKNVTALTTTLTVNIDNFQDLPTVAEVTTGFTKLTTLVLKGTATADKDLTIPNYNATKKLVTLDLSELSPKAGKTITLGAQNTNTNLVTAKLPGVDIPNDVFKNCTALKTVTGIKNVGDNAFSGCAALESIDLSKAETIGQSAFVGTKLASVDLSSAKLIGKDAFKDVATLKDVTFGKPLEKIMARAFQGTGMTVLSLSKCKNLTTANITGDNVFPANAWTSIKLAGSQVNVGKVDLTKANESLKKLTISAYESTDLTDGAGNGLFAGFTALTTVEFAVDETASPLPVGLTDIGDNAFGYDAINDAYCSSLTSIELPATLETIGKGAFEGAALTAISIPASVTTIDDDAFTGCGALTDLSFVAPEEGNPTMKIGKRAFEGTAVAKVKLTSNVIKLGSDAFKDCTSLKSFTAEGLTAIYASFDGCENLKTVYIPGTVTEIKDNAFKDLAKLATVTFGHNSADGDVLNSIGASAFEGCEALTAIDLSATALPDLANTNVFSGCTALATITLPEELTGNLGYGIFAGTAITKLDVSNLAPQWNGLTYVRPTVNNLFGTSVAGDVVNTTLKSLKIGDAYILNGAFENCTALKSVVLGAANIETDAFAYCTKLAAVELAVNTASLVPGQLIEEGAFDHCTALKNFKYEPADPTEVPNPIWSGGILINGFSELAFTACTPFVQFNTSEYFVLVYKDAPVNCTYGDGATETYVKTVQDKANANQFVAKYVNNNACPVVIDAADAKVYSIYVDGEDAYFQACRTYKGKYVIQPAVNNHVIIKTDVEKEVKVTMDDSGWAWSSSSIGFDDIYDSQFGDELADVQAGLFVGAGEYIYRLTNTADQGFGFTAYTSTTVKEGQFFIKSTKKPAGAGRLNTIWLDEDGNAENEATAIQKVQNTDAENGAIYNLQGVRVEKAQKGLYIQNGKKFVVK